MINYKTIKYTTALIITILLSGCESYLEETPDDRLELDSLEKAAKVVADSYSQGSYVFTDMYTDLAGPTGNPDANGVVQTAGGNIIRTQDLQTYSWEDVTAIFQDTPTYYWDRTYAAIAQANQVLAVLDDLEGDVDYKNAIKGEALLSRAYHHFMLVNIFGLHYDDDAGINLGVPYITQPETEFLPTYTRNTVQEVYDLVEKDMLEGMELIDDSFFEGTKKYHFTSKAGQAFASRFYLWKGDYANCIKYSDLFLGGNPQLYVKNYDNINGSGYNDSAEQYNDRSDESNVLVMQKFSLYQRRNIGFRLNNTDLNLLFFNILGSNDERISTGIWRIGTDARYLARFREYFFRENLTSNSGQPYVIFTELKGEEVLLNRSEAHLLSGNQEAAMADLNILAAARYSGNTYDNVTNIVTTYGAPNETIGILLLLLDERKKEFWEHGLRWFDIKRFDIPVTHVLPVNEGGNTIELPSGDLRRAIQIPADAQSFGLTPNPR